MSTLIPTPVSLTLEAEIMTDADTGRPNLIAAVDGDTWQETTPDKLRACAQRIREQLAAVERMAAQFEAMQALRVLLAEWCADLFEAPASMPLPGDAECWGARVDGHYEIVVRAGQTPTGRLQVVREYFAHIASTAVTA